MSYDEFKLCKGCPVKGARYFDPDGYWCCRHPDAHKHKQPEVYPEEILEKIKDTPAFKFKNTDAMENPVPFVCLKTCPCDHWKRTIEGGLIPKGQTELVTDAERMA